MEDRMRKISGGGEIDTMEKGRVKKRKRNQG